MTKAGVGEKALDHACQFCLSFQHLTRSSFVADVPQWEN